MCAGSAPPPRCDEDHRAAPRIAYGRTGTRPGVGNDKDQPMTPDLPPPVEAPDLGNSPDEEETEGGRRLPDPEHGPGGDTASGEPPD